jgi:hypothetical protein
MFQQGKEVRIAQSKTLAPKWGHTSVGFAAWAATRSRSRCSGQGMMRNSKERCWSRQPRPTRTRSSAETHISDGMLNRSYTLPLPPPSRWVANGQRSLGSNASETQRSLHQIWVAFQGPSRLVQVQLAPSRLQIMSLAFILFFACHQSMQCQRGVRILRCQPWCTFPYKLTDCCRSSHIKKNCQVEFAFSRAVLSHADPQICRVSITRHHKTRYLEGHEGIVHKQHLDQMSRLCLLIKDDKRQLSQPDLGQSNAMRQPAFQLEFLARPSITHTSSSKNLYANLKSAFRRFIL